MLSLSKKLSELPGIGSKRLKAFNKLGLQTIEDLIYHFPRYFEDWGETLSIAQLKSKGKGQIKVKINLIHQKRTYKKKMLLTEAIVSDGKDSLKVIWFNQPFLKGVLENKEVYLAGKIENNPSYGMSLINPVWEKVSPHPIHTKGLVPIYSLTEGITQKQIRSLIWLILQKIPYFEDWLPLEIKKKDKLAGLNFALRQIHFPKSYKHYKIAQARLRFNELFLIALANRIIKQTLKKKTAPTIKFNENLTKKFVASLPFKLTPSQKKESWRIIKELKGPSPMSRLLCGDVGSGKTIVAVIAILNCLDNKLQAVYMAPTEILAEQFFEKVKILFKNFPWKIGLLTKGNYYLNSKKIKTKKTIIEYISQGKIDLIVGTHSLITQKEPLKFKNLGLIIIDEQHRFGVSQRAKLVNALSADHKKEGKIVPHFLSLSATPIPRTLALTAYGDLDISYLSDTPPGRKKVITKIFREQEKKIIYKLIKERLKNKETAFIICPLIDPSGKIDSKSVKEEYKKIKEEFCEFKVAILHGRIKNEEKRKIMEEFRKGKINILVTTNVIEVGIDIPRATVMLIEGAERFGLSQLYQLRGRIGRSEKQSYCFLVYKDKGETKKRLEAFLQAKNGLELAEKDLILRGPGELFGHLQSGQIDRFSLIDFKDIDSIKRAKRIANGFLDKYKDIKKFPKLWKKAKEYLKS